MNEAISTVVRFDAGRQWPEYSGGKRPSEQDTEVRRITSGTGMSIGQLANRAVNDERDKCGQDCGLYCSISNSSEHVDSRPTPMGGFEDVDWDQHEVQVTIDCNAASEGCTEHIASAATSIEGLRHGKRTVSP